MLEVNNCPTGGQRPALPATLTVAAEAMPLTVNKRRQGMLSGLVDKQHSTTPVRTAEVSGLGSLLWLFLVS